ncbi:hypothetical protein MSAN_02452700 [Mycena sanguinolenta]|uniref:Uncharacterized protein n=1 Tax=Mycena sanguinolenta TaxID=230812 RepID=A0A8H6WXY1_9AGAR|nr:hypothetical protein MSAN_02452700 [Mycena sanguinolenta]
MDEQTHTNTDFTHSTTSNPGSPPYTTGMFSHSERFTVTGKTFTNITNNYAAALSLPPDLQHEIRVDECTGAANLQRERACVRRVYSAKARIDGRRSRVTVAVYQGSGAKEKWRQDITEYMSKRHPNIIQIAGAASSKDIHATLFNDDLIPVGNFLDRYRNFPVLTVYIYACCNSDFSVRNFDPLSSKALTLRIAGSAQVYAFSISTKTLANGMSKMDTSLDWSAVHRAYPNQ